ncbi:HIT-like protein [Meredithblackwellia eburnea MCA 4105]
MTEGRAANEDKECIFCKIIAGEIPSYKLLETDKLIAFLDISPVSDGHLLVVPKFHAQKILDIPDDYLLPIAPTLKKMAVAAGCSDFNVLQSNGTPAGQTVNHVHFHMIPRIGKTGFDFQLPTEFPKIDLKASFARIKENL